MSDTSLVEALDEAVRRRRLLDHPFYEAWAAGELTLDDLAFYSTQYWRQVEAFPGFLRSLAPRVDDAEAREILESNLRDEVEDDHPAMWVDFAAWVGVNRSELEERRVQPETATCIGAFADAAATASVPFALGMLYGYESQTPEVAKTKVEGLRDHYGIVGDGTRYFELHGELDVEHARDLGVALSKIVRGDEDRAEAIAGAAAGAEAVWTLLDGVARERDLVA